MVLDNAADAAEMTVHEVFSPTLLFLLCTVWALAALKYNQPKNKLKPPIT
jgi:hypothetical protein